MEKIFVLGYSVVCYVVGLAVVAYYADFFVGYLVPKFINSEPQATPFSAALVNVILLIAFCLQHSLMARPVVKERMRRYVPFAMERSTYILLSSWAIMGLCIYWQPIPVTIFDARNTVIEPVLWSLYAVGWGITLFSTFLIDHFDLFGLKQAWCYGRTDKTFVHRFVTPLLYKVVRHPIYLGWFMVHWFTPLLTVGQFLMASAITVYIFVAIRFEERDLAKTFGETYLAYRKTTPALFPTLNAGKKMKKGSNEELV